MDIDKTLEDKFQLNILCYSLGSTSESFFSHTVNLLNASVRTSIVPNSFQTELREKGKQCVPNKDWSRANIRCRYYRRNPAADWTECQIFYRCHAAIIIVDLETYNAQLFPDDLVKLKKTMQNDQIVPYRVFAFNATEEHLGSALSQDKSVAIFPCIMKRDEDLVPVFQDELEIIIRDTALHCFGEIQRLKQDSHTIALFNAKEEIPKDLSKIKKRKQGRSIKLCGDLALILGCFKDALLYFTQAYEILNSNEDYLWIGQIRESQAACVLLEYLGLDKDDQQVLKNAAKVVESVNEKMQSASAYFRKAKNQSLKSSDFDKECFFKLLKVLKDIGAKNSFSELVKFYIEAIRSAPSAEEHYKALLKIGGFFYDMKMYRKAGLFLKLVADAILQYGNNEPLARDIYLVCFPLFNLPLNNDILPDSFPKDEFLQLMATNQDLKNEIKRVSPFLQLQLVNDVLAISQQDVPLQTKIISIILRYFNQDTQNYNQQRLFNHLITLGNTLNRSLKLDLTFLPEIVRVSPVTEVLKVTVKQFEPGSGDKSGLFIYNPWKKGGAGFGDFNWMVGNVCYVKVYIRNVFEFDVYIDMITLVTEGARTINYPTSVILRKSKTLQELTLKLKPLETGTIHLLGINSRLSNFVHFHPLNNKGLILKTPLEVKRDSIGIRNVPIKEKIGTLKATFEDSRDEITFYQSGLFYTRVLLENRNESSVILRRVVVSFAFSDNTTLDRELPLPNVEIGEYEVFSLIVFRAVPGEEQLIQNLFKMQPNIMLNVFDINKIERLFKIYIKVIYYEKNKPNISIEDNITKEVKMLKSLSLTNVRICNWIAHDQVTFGGKSYKHSSLDQDFYVSFDVVRDSPEVNQGDYFLSVYVRGTEKPIAERLMVGSCELARIVVTIDRNLVASHTDGLEALKTLIYGKWKEIHSIDSGYLVLNDIDLDPIVEKAEKKGMKVNFEIPDKGIFESGKFIRLKRRYSGMEM